MNLSEIGLTYLIFEMKISIHCEYTLIEIRHNNNDDEDQTKFIHS